MMMYYCLTVHSVVYKEYISPDLSSLCLSLLSLPGTAYRIPSLLKYLSLFLYLESTRNQTIKHQPDTSTVLLKDSNKSVDLTEKLAFA